MLLNLPSLIRSKWISVHGLRRIEFAPIILNDINRPDIAIIKQEQKEQKQQNNINKKTRKNKKKREKRKKRKNREKAQLLIIPYFYSHPNDHSLAHNVPFVVPSEHRALIIAYLLDQPYLCLSISFCLAGDRFLMTYCPHGVAKGFFIRSDTYQNNTDVTSTPFPLSFIDAQYPEIYDVNTVYTSLFEMHDGRIIMCVRNYTFILDNKMRFLKPLKFPKVFYSITIPRYTYAHTLYWKKLNIFCSIPSSSKSLFVFFNEVADILFEFNGTEFQFLIRYPKMFVSSYETVDGSIFICYVDGQKIDIIMFTQSLIRTTNPMSSNTKDGDQKDTCPHNPLQISCQYRTFNIDNKYKYSRLYFDGTTCDDPFNPWVVISNSGSYSSLHRLKSICKDLSNKK